MDSLHAVLHDSLALADRALGKCAQLESECLGLRAKTAEQERVILEKVASRGLDSRLIDATLLSLEEMSLMNPDDHKKVASELQEDPNAALRLAQRLITLSVPAHQEGGAIEKSAGTTGSTVDPDGWNEVVRPRAAQ